MIPRSKIKGLENKVPLIFFTSLYILFFGALAFIKENIEFLFYLLVMSASISFILTIHKRIICKSSTLWLLSIWGLLHMMGGLLSIPIHWPIRGESHVLYNLWLVKPYLKYDQLVHAFGFGVCTLLCWECLTFIVQASRVEKLRPTLGTLTLVACAAMGLGALNEVIEFIITLLIPNTNVGDYENTAWDLVFNLFGALFACFYIRNRKPTELTKQHSYGIV